MFDLLNVEQKRSAHARGPLRTCRRDGDLDASVLAYAAQSDTCVAHVRAGATHNRVIEHRPLRVRPYHSKASFSTNRPNESWSVTALSSGTAGKPS